MQSFEDLLAQAIEIVKAEKNVSATFLQRKLDIWFSLACKIVDAMEEQGLVGPETWGKGPRALYLCGDPKPEPKAVEEEYDATLRNVKVVSSPDGYRLLGFIYGDKKGRFPDGHHVRTSPIKWEIASDAKFVETKHTKYKIEWPMQNSV